MDKVGWGSALVGATGAATAILAWNQYNKNTAQVVQYETDIAQLEAQRIAISNPYAQVQDLSGTLSNPYENLSVATKAAEFQAEEADIALANTLDTLRALGTGAGGATALAQAALKSKQGVSQSIEQQEVNNQKLKAQGEQTLQQAKLAESQRMQQAGVEGDKWMFEQTDERQMQKLDRTQAMLDQERANAASNQAAMYGALSDTLGGLGTIIAG